MGAPDRVRWNLLAAPPARWALRSPLFPVALQAVALAALCLLAANGLSGGSASAAELLVLRRANLTTLVVWGLWWPAMIAVALTLGRLWCMVCPLELANRLGETVARRLGKRRARMPGPFREGWSALAVYVSLQVLTAGVAMDSSPRATGLLLPVLVGLAVGAGLLFRSPRSFCRALCPASPLLAVYSRFTPVQLDVAKPEVCAHCKSKDCVRTDLRHRFDGRSCPSALRPYERRQLDGCVACLQCAKVCPKQNVALGLVHRSAPSRKLERLAPFTAAYLAVDTGFVANEIIEDVPWLEGPFHFVPGVLTGVLPHFGSGWLEALWFLALFPALLWGTVAVLAYARGHCGPLGSLLVSATTAAAPVIALAHLAKAVNKAAGWSAWLPAALANPSGRSALVGEVAARPPVTAVWVVGALALAVAAAFCAGSWRRSAWMRE